jgi:methylenetetrahydrofolate reductase (NADPH)
MAAQQPLYADMTWGAGGSTSDLTLDLCTKMTYDAGMVANMHLTCTNMEAEKVDIALNSAREVGIRNIVALRGDPPAGKEEWKATEGGFSCALDLVKHMRATHGDYFCISVAGYPEGHPNAIKPVEDESKLTEDELTRVVRNKDGIFCCHAADYESEMAYLKEKVDAGADFIITQMFFETAVFVKFVKDCRARGIMCPVMPGIMLIQAYGGFSRMTLMCKSRVPQEVFDRVEAVKDDKDALKEYGTELGAQICNELIAAGFKGLHLYTLNLEAVTYGVMDKLGLKKAVPK